MMASCPRTVRPQQHFWVKYTLLNNLQDFLAVRLIWNSEGEYQILQTVPSVWEIIICSLSWIWKFAHLQRVESFILIINQKSRNKNTLHERKWRCKLIYTKQILGGETLVTVSAVIRLFLSPGFHNLSRDFGMLWFRSPGCCFAFQSFTSFFSQSNPIFKMGAKL